MNAFTQVRIAIAHTSEPIQEVYNFRDNYLSATYELTGDGVLDIDIPY